MSPQIVEMFPSGIKHLTHLAYEAYEDLVVHPDFLRACGQDTDDNEIRAVVRLAWTFGKFTGPVSERCP